MIDINNIQVCPGTLAPGFTSYSPKCIKEVFGGKRVSHILPFPSPQTESEQRKLFLENRSLISISGAQEKYSLRLNNKTLELTDKGGAFILKPIPVDLLNVSQVPANEHLTMQIAEQVFKLQTAKNALIFFADGVPAYITRRFDVKADGTRCLKEDFASIAGFTSANKGKDFKYDSSYEEIARLIDACIPAAVKAKEQLFQMVVFNYLFSNGDAHLKNFSRIDYKGEGDAFLAPAYDLINTRLHIDDGDMALHDGLYQKDYEHRSYGTYGYYAYDDFYEFGLRIGLVQIRVKRMLQDFLEHREQIILLTQQSFLSDEMKDSYIKLYDNKRKRLSTSLQQIIS
jgi:serine/threonine-protein kinase HipA